MSEHGEAMRRPARASLPPRSRKRWKIAAGVAVAWVVLFAISGSVTGATVLLIVLAAFAVVAFFGLRALGVTRDHPWIQRIAARPWRDGQEVLQIALKHLPEVFVVTPSGTLLAPNIVELRMNPEDLRSLGERMEPALVMESATEVYLEQVQEHGARFARPAPAEVRMIVDPSVPPGRYRLRQGQPVDAGLPGAPSPQLAHAGAAPASPDSHVGAYPVGLDSHVGAYPVGPDSHVGYPVGPGSHVGYPVGPDSHVGAYPAMPDAHGRPTPALPEPQVRGNPADRRGDGRASEPGLEQRLRRADRHGAHRAGHSDAPAGHRGRGRGDPDVRGPGRARAGGAGAAGGAHGVPGACPVHVLRRPVADRQPGHERAHRERRASDR